MKRKTSHSRPEPRAFFSLCAECTAASVKAAEPSVGCRLSTRDGGRSAAVWFSFFTGKHCDPIQQWFTDGLIQVRNPNPRFLAFASSGPVFFFFFFGLRDENEPTAPANEDLVGANSFQEPWLCASACVGRRKKKKKKKAPGPFKMP